MGVPRGVLPLVALILVLPTTGCVANMGDVKTLLGVTGDAPPVEDPLPPVAVARANLTLTTVGAPVLFSSAGSDDPDGLITTFAWDFGDGARAADPVTAHTFDAPGEYEVRLAVTDDAGLTADDFVTVTVRADNARPNAAFTVLDARNRPVTSGDAGNRLAFDATASRDADGDNLAFEWDFGDGATGVGASAQHTFERPGTYVVRLTVRDPAGATATASRVIAQNLNATWMGEEFAAGSSKGARKTFTLPVPQDGSRVAVTLRYDGEFGMNDLQLRIVDANGATVAEAQAGDNRLGSGGDRVKRLTLTPDILRAHEGGDWGLVVTKAKGVQVTFDLEARVVA